jgi:hypothetical protein
MSKNSNNLLNTFEEGYLSAWANAVEKAQPRFTYKMKNYNTKGGSSIK